MGGCMFARLTMANSCLLSLYASQALFVSGSEKVPAPFLRTHTRAGYFQSLSLLSHHNLRGRRYNLSDMVNERGHKLRDDFDGLECFLCMFSSACCEARLQTPSSLCATLVVSGYSWFLWPS